MCYRDAKKGVDIQSAQTFSYIKITHLGIDPYSCGAHSGQGYSDYTGFITRGCHEDDTGPFVDTHFTETGGNGFHIGGKFPVTVVFVAAPALWIKTIQIDYGNTLRIFLRNGQNDISQVKYIIGK